MHSHQRTGSTEHWPRGSRCQFRAQNPARNLARVAMLAAAFIVATPAQADKASVLQSAVGDMYVYGIEQAAPWHLFELAPPVEVRQPGETVAAGSRPRPPEQGQLPAELREALERERQAEAVALARISAVIIKTLLLIMTSNTVLIDCGKLTTRS